MREAASRGFWMSSEAPLGYDRVMVQDGPKKRPKLELDHDSSHVVRRMFDMSEAGKSTLDIARILNDEGITSPRGKPWGKTSVHAILINETYTGTLTWGVNAKDGADPVRVANAFPAIISTAQFNRVSKLLRSRAPRIVNPRRVASPFLLSGLVRCRTCRRALTGQGSKYAQFTYYVCQTLMKRGKGSCDAPRLNARRFEEMVVERIRSNFLTVASIPDLAEAVDEEIDSMVAEHRKRLQTIESEIEDVKKQVDRIWRYIATRDGVDEAKTSARMAEYLDRHDRLEDAAANAREVLAQHRSAMGDAGEIAEYAREMDDFLDRSELTERRAFIESFVREVVVMPGAALLRYTIPISQSTRKAQVLVGGGSEEFRVGDAADACRQLYARAASCRHLLKQGKFRQLNHSNW